jgi:hypothetical protein
MVHDSIFTEGKNYTNERGGKDREMAVPRPPILVGHGLLHIPNKVEVT